MKFDRTTEFPWTADGSTIYLNAASTGPLPARTAAVLDEWTRLRREPWRIALEDQFGTLARARELSARLIGAEPREIALVPNTSTGINLAAAILPVADGKTILGHDGEFPANVYPWMALAQRIGGRFEQLALGPDSLPDWDALGPRLDRGDVGLVALSWVSFVSGDRADIARIGRMCREHGVWIVVDAIQGVGASVLDVRECAIDVLACGAQKWLLSPWGSGFCYVRRELVDALEPHAVGWLAMRGSHDFSRMLDYDFTYFEDARRYEVATIPYQDMAGMVASLELIHEIGLVEIARHVESLATRLVEGISAMRSLSLVTPRDPSRRAGIVSLRAADAEHLSARLTSAGIVHSVRGHGVLRFAPHIYNTSDEMERVLEQLGG